MPRYSTSCQALLWSWHEEHTASMPTLPARRQVVWVLLSQYMQAAHERVQSMWLCAGVA